MKFPLPSLAALLAAALLAIPAGAETSNKWRLEFSGNAESDGRIELSILEVGAVVATVAVPVVKGTGENDVSRRVRDELQLQLPKGRYSVEGDDGEDVLIKKNGDVADFEVRIAGNSVQGVSIDADRE
jgi:hypothetical protein